VAERGDHSEPAHAAQLATTGHLDLDSDGSDTEDTDEDTLESATASLANREQSAGKPARASARRPSLVREDLFWTHSFRRCFHHYSAACDQSIRHVLVSCGSLVVDLVLWGSFPSFLGSCLVMFVTFRRLVGQLLGDGV